MGKSISDNKLPDVEDIQNSLKIEDKGNELDKYKCLLEGCKDAANKIMTNVDVTKDPCENFYDYACGHFIEQSTIPDDKNTFNYLTVIQNKVQQDLKTSLESELNSTEPKIYQLIKTYYKSCMLNSSEIEERSLKKLKDIIKELGGWPVVEGKEWDKDAFEWTKLDSMLKTVGFSPKAIFNVRVFNDLTDTKRLVLYVDPFVPFLDYITLKKGLSNPVVSAYEDLFRNIAVFLGAEKSQARKESTRVVEFEIKLAEAATTEEEKKIKFQTIKDLKTHIPDIPWKEYINNFTEPIVHMKRSSEIYVRNPNYILDVATLLKDTPKKTLANYMLWRFIVETIPYVNGKLREIKRLFYRDSSRDEPEREDECLELITKKSGLMVGVSVLYVKEHFDHRARQAISPILSAIVEELKDMMSNYTWIKKSSRVEALKKSKSMKRIIAYPNELLDEEVIDNYIAPLSLQADDHFQNYLNLNQFHYNFSLSGLLETADHRLWTELSDSTDSNAYYYTIYNAINLLAAILQPPIFNPEWPSNALFGSVGFIIGHEIMHAFDMKNIHFDNTGSFNKWVSKRDKEVFKYNAECFIKQYEKFNDTKTNMQVNGKKTLNENLADYLGMKVTVGAYKRWSENAGGDLTLPGLGYSPEQLFWLSAVSFMCSKKTDEKLFSDFAFNAHSPDHFRVNGALQNSHEFAKAFKCKPGSTMNPKDKCFFY